MPNGCSSIFPKRYSVKAPQHCPKPYIRIGNVYGGVKMIVNGLAKENQ
jgi:hypothetical protein